ncbi:hypothetical protein, partial [Campylobacter jejuni]|uniref:hypothetical protein n=1 Tax=Campylobacter jejuni TaxID=197 RepID=UPI001E63D52D
LYRLIFLRRGSFPISIAIVSYQEAYRTARLFFFRFLLKLIGILAYGVYRIIILKLSQLY